MKILLPPSWPRPKGYANGVSVRGRVVFMASMIDWDAQGVFHTDGLTDQVRQILQNITEVLAAGDAKPEHAAYMTWYVTDRKTYVAAYLRIGKAFRGLIGSFNIAMTAAEVGALVEDRAKVEIEVTTVVPDQDDLRTDGTQRHPYLYKSVYGNRGGLGTVDASPFNQPQHPCFTKQRMVTESGLCRSGESMAT